VRGLAVSQQTIKHVAGGRTRVLEILVVLVSGDFGCFILNIQIQNALKF
jgi:TctA family transporter